MISATLYHYHLDGSQAVVYDVIAVAGGQSNAVLR